MKKLNKNKKKTYKPITLKFLVESHVNILCKLSSSLVIICIPCKFSLKDILVYIKKRCKKTSTIFSSKF